MTMGTFARGWQLPGSQFCCDSRSTRLHLHSHKSSGAWGWGIATCLIQALRPVLCGRFRRERKWSAKKTSSCFPPFILQKKKRLKALLEWLHWLPWLSWASICKTDRRRENPSSTSLPCNSWKWHLCSAAGKITHLSLIFFYPATPNLLMPTTIILIFSKEE